MIFFILFHLFITFSAFCNEETWHTLQGWQYEFLQIYQQPPQWMLDQIHADLAEVSHLNASYESLNQFMKAYEGQNQRWWLARFFIHKNHVFVQNCIPNDGCDSNVRRTRVEWMKKCLVRLALCVPLPNVNFIVCLLDSLDSDTSSPVFVFAKNPRLAPRGVLIPDFESMNGNENFLHAVRTGNERHPWDSKKNQALFRGSMTGGNFNLNSFLTFPRSKAVALSFQFPELIDARFSYSSDTEKFGRYRDFFSPGMSVEDQVAYKYQLLIDGNSCAYSRAYWQLFSNCVLFKQTSENIQWFYRPLQPYVHYIPIAWDMSDLVEQIDWAMEHDEEAEKMSKQAQDFAKNNLTYPRVMQYLYHLLIEYAKLQNSL